MPNGDHHWWAWAGEIGKWVVIGLASLASSAALFVARHYRRDKKRLASTYRYYRVLSKNKVLTKVNNHEAALKRLEDKIDKVQHLADQLDDTVKSLNNAASSLHATVTNLTALVERRGKEHHELRDMLAPIVTRLAVIETTLDIKRE